MATIDATAGPTGLGGFLKSLAEEGRAVVAGGVLQDEPAIAREALERLDAVARAELGLEAPPFCAEAAHWAARLFYHLCQFTVCRDIGQEQILAVCNAACPAPRAPATDWSADLTLRHLPRLFQLARHLSSADPLVQQMQRLAVAWPLSSVGMPGLEGWNLDSCVSHPALRRLYADRILAAGDVSRLGDPRVDAVLRADLGVYRDLAPCIAEKLFQTS